MLSAEATTWISERAAKLGFARCGVVRAENFPELLQSADWIARGYAGEMKYLSDPRRTDPQGVMSGIKSVIVCALTYHTEHVRTGEASAHLEDTHNVEGPRGWISRYAWGDDYHEVLQGKLKSLSKELELEFGDQFTSRIYADTGPINERVFAKHAGLGWIGKNTLLLNEKLGSYFFLGVILTTLELQPTLGSTGALPDDRCGTCRRCIEACPTNALVEPYVMDARNCISYLTIELRGSIPEELRPAMGQHVYGCDICQDVCPWNRDVPVTQAQQFQPRIFPRSQEKFAGVAQTMDSGDEKNSVDESKSGIAEENSLLLPRLEWLASISEEQFHEMFRGSAIKRTKWRGLMRNVCITLGNSGVGKGSVAYERVRGILSRLEQSAEPVIVESARWASSRIQASGTV
ncbi:MAG: tRNA epoxyqueuosine(34) reductase QueG [Acidobacteriota bacterium]|nr:tRNA epoxyqueuosine(34) reductase QueG [Acidobacteriota bacterium]